MRSPMIHEVEALRAPHMAAEPLRAVLDELFREAFELGNVHAQRELGRADSANFAITEEQVVLEWIAANVGEIASNILDDRIMAVLKQILLDGLANDLPVSEIVAQAQVRLFPLIGAAATGATPAQIETIVRTLLTKAYNQGRRSFFEDPANAGYVRAYRWSAVLDDRTTEFCRAMNGRTFPIDDPIWRTLGAPPAHFNCRSLLVPVVLGEAYRPSKYPVGVEPSPGFGELP